MKPIPPHTIIPYQPRYKGDVERFREISFKEGNNSLAHDKFDPEGFMGQIWLVYVDGKLIGLSAIEASHYTGDPRIAARVVRLHVLKQYRSTAFGLVLMPYQIQWCKKKGYKIMWWSIDIDMRALNAVYQKKHFPVYTQHKDAWDGWFQDLVFDKRMIYQVDPRSDLLQFVYYFRLEDKKYGGHGWEIERYKWKPKSNMFYYYHNGDSKLIKRMRPFLSETHIDLAT
jgi:GNAT superfamily N-acetyltransferase